MSKYAIEYQTGLYIIEAKSIMGALQIFIRDWFEPTDEIWIKRVNGTG